VPKKSRQPERKSNKTEAAATDREAEVRIIGGQFRGRRLHYHGDPVVRPMKHRTREAIFNLVSTECTGKHAIDLFAGTGALGLEALSRGATSATFIEKHVPSARVVEENIRTLGVEGRAKLLVTSAFLWAKRDLPAPARELPSAVPWLIFCSPPYAFYTDRTDEMLDLIQRIQTHAPPDSILIVESDAKFSFGSLNAIDKAATSWSVRDYPPARIGILRKAISNGEWLGANEEQLPS
jgi:16S rRNA (guanine966-N2)-methyltransferase